MHFSHLAISICLCFRAAAYGEKGPQPPQYICKQTISQPAGLRGSIEFADKCNISLIGIKFDESARKQYSITGLRKEASCGKSEQLFINTKSYCLDKAVKLTTISVIDGQINIYLPKAPAARFTLTYYRALTCDIKSIPKVNLTIYRIVPHPKRGDRTLPGRVKVTYICAPTLVLENPGKDSIECHYNVDPDNEAHVTANWTTEEGINCIFVRPWWYKIILYAHFLLIPVCILSVCCCRSKKVLCFSRIHRLAKNFQGSE